MARGRPRNSQEKNEENMKKRAEYAKQKYHEKKEKNAKLVEDFMNETNELEKLKFAEQVIINKAMKTVDVFYHIYNNINEETANEVCTIPQNRKKESN